MKFSNPLLPGKIRHCFTFLVVVILPILISACSGPMEPEPEAMNGLIGRVVDSSGVALDSVSIYCYYLFNPGMIEPGYEVSIPNKLKKTAGFDYSFYGNYPNPVYNSTYVKFSLPPGKSQVTILLTRKSASKASYVYSGLYDGGLYQYYFKNIVESLKLMNGPYTVSYSAQSDSGRKFSAYGSMFVVSDRGNPNAATNSRGEYYLPFREAFVGDSVVRYDNDFQYPWKYFLGNNTNLYIKRRGFKPLIMQVTIFRNLLLHQDIVLFKEEKK